VPSRSRQRVLQLGVGPGDERGDHHLAHLVLVGDRHAVQVAAVPEPPHQLPQRAEPARAQKPRLQAGFAAAEASLKQRGRTAGAYLKACLK